MAAENRRPGLGGRSFSSLPIFSAGATTWDGLCLLSLVAVTAAAWWLRHSVRAKPAGGRRSPTASCCWRSAWWPANCPAAGDVDRTLGSAKRRAVALVATQAIRRAAGPLEHALAHAACHDKGARAVPGLRLLFVVVVQRIDDATDVRRIVTLDRLSGRDDGGVRPAAVLPVQRPVLLVLRASVSTSGRVSLTAVSSTVTTSPISWYWDSDRWWPGWWASMRRDASGRRDRRAGPVCMRNTREASPWASPLTIVSLAVLLSMSRGGTLALLASIVVLGLVYAHARLVDAGTCGGAIGLAVVSSRLLSLHGYDQVTQQTGRSDRRLVRRGRSRSEPTKIWKANIDGIQSRNIHGSRRRQPSRGLSGVPAESSPLEFTHAENGYLQIATETGIGGVALLAPDWVCAELGA